MNISVRMQLDVSLMMFYNKSSSEVSGFFQHQTSLSWPGHHYSGMSHILEGVNNHGCLCFMAYQL